MTKIPYIKTDSGLTAIINGKSFSITDDNPSYAQVWDALQKGEPAYVVADLFNTALAIRRWSGNNIEVRYNQLYYKGEVIDNVVADRIVELISQGYNADPLIKFLENLLANPSRRAVTELYSFLQHKNLPITEDGCFLAYKGVNDDYTDRHTGTYVNRPGANFKMLRNLVDDDLRRACSNGFHVGSLEYATSFGPRCLEGQIFDDIVFSDAAFLALAIKRHRHHVCRVDLYNYLPWAETGGVFQ